MPRRRPNKTKTNGEQMSHQSLSNEGGGSGKEGRGCTPPALLEQQPPALTPRRRGPRRPADFGITLALRTPRALECRNIYPACVETPRSLLVHEERKSTSALATKWFVMLPFVLATNITKRTNGA